MEGLPQRLKRLRKKFGWTQQIVADKLSITIGTYSGYERGYRKPDADMLKKLAIIFNTTTDYILGHTDNPHPIKNMIEEAWLHSEDDPLKDLPEEARQSVMEFIEYVKAKYRNKTDKKGD